MWKPIVFHWSSAKEPINKQTKKKRFKYSKLCFFSPCTFSHVPAPLVVCCWTKSAYHQSDWEEEREKKRNFQPLPLGSSRLHTSVCSGSSVLCASVWIMIYLSCWSKTRLLARRKPDSFHLMLGMLWKAKETFWTRILMLTACACSASCSCWPHQENCA